MVLVYLLNGRRLHGPSYSENPGGCHFVEVALDDVVLAHSTFEQWETHPKAELQRLVEAACGGQTGTDIGLGAELAVRLLEFPHLELRAATDGEWVRVVDRTIDEVDGEIAYWDCNEWREDPELVIGALFGVLLGGG